MTLAEKASEMQNNSAAVPRLNIPAAINAGELVSQITVQ